MTIFLICCQLMRHSLSKLFHLSNLFQMPNECRVVDSEFFSNFLGSCKRIRFDDCSQLVIVNFRWPATMSRLFGLFLKAERTPTPPAQQCRPQAARPGVLKGQLLLDSAGQGQRADGWLRLEASRESVVTEWRAAPLEAGSGPGTAWHSPGTGRLCPCC